MKQPSLPLTQERVDALNLIAQNLDAVASRGTNIGEPSWRALIRKIADGELIVYRPAQVKPKTVFES